MHIAHDAGRYWLVLGTGGPWLAFKTDPETQRKECQGFQRTRHYCGDCCPLDVTGVVVSGESSAANRSIGSTTGFHNHGEGPY